MNVSSHTQRGWVGAAALRLLVLLAFLVLGLAPLARAADIAITQPAQEQTIHDNLGNVQVQVQTSGAAPGSQVRLIVDGAVQPLAGGGAIVLRGLARGSHVLKAELLGPDGTLVAVATPVTFYLWQASRRNPHRAR